MPSWSDAWITVPVRSSDDVEHASWLFDLRYRQIYRAPDDKLLERIGGEIDLLTGLASRH